MKNKPGGLSSGQQVRAPVLQVHLTAAAPGDMLIYSQTERFGLPAGEARMEREMRECERCFTQLEPGVNCGEDQSVCDLCWDEWDQLIATDENDALERLNFDDFVGEWDQLVAEDATDLADRLGFSNHSE